MIVPVIHIEIHIIPLIIVFVIMTIIIILECKIDKWNIITINTDTLQKIKNLFEGFNVFDYCDIDNEDYQYVVVYDNNAER